jgi:hypothetical protein
MHIDCGIERSATLAELIDDPIQVPVPNTTFLARRDTSHADSFSSLSDLLDIWGFRLFLSLLTDTAERRYHTHRFQPFC